MPCGLRRRGATSLTQRKSQHPAEDAVPGTALIAGSAKKTISWIWLVKALLSVSIVGKTSRPCPRLLFPPPVAALCSLLFFAFLQRFQLRMPIQFSHHHWILAPVFGYLHK